MSEFSHISEQNEVSMVDVSEKQPTKRQAIARVKVILPEEIANRLREDGFRTPKGPIFEIARIAGIMAAKKTGELIPLCHPIGLDHADVKMTLEKNEVIIICSSSVFAKTGIEMEAMMGASIAALTIYDMCKALSHDIRITDLELLMKTGGKSDYRKEAS